jgi:hypothetical protein
VLTTVVVLARNPTYWHLIPLGRCIEPRLLDLVNTHDFLAGNVVMGIVVTG